MLYLKCNTDGIPTLDRAGEFPLLNPVFDFTYRSPTHALHLYEYDGELKLNDEIIKFRAGDATCTPAGAVAAYRSEAPGKHWVIHFYDAPTKKGPAFNIPSHIPFGSNSLFILEQFKVITRLFNTPVVDEARERMLKLEASYRLKSLLLSLYNLTVTRKRGTRSRSTFVWDELLLLIDSNLNQQLTTSWLAKRVNIGANTLSQKFRKEYGCTISQYILKKRIDKAKSLLTTTTLTINEVGTSVGIDDPQYFNKQFRKVTGISPSRYRDDNKEYLILPPEELKTLGGTWEDH